MRHRGNLNPYGTCHLSSCAGKSKALKEKFLSEVRAGKRVCYMHHDKNLYGNQLPITFRSWRDVWNKCSEILLPGNELFSVTEEVPGGNAKIQISEYIMSIEYIKARCWEEVEYNLPTHESVQRLCKCLIPQSGGLPLQKTILNLHSLCSK
jgi:hypothetical protein